MPLPPALLARLKKRGLVQSADKDEEVFAESYDETEGLGHQRIAAGNRNSRNCTADEADVPAHLLGLPSGKTYLIFPTSKCPNACNPYHRCVNYCFERWGKVAFRPDLTKINRRARMLSRYPLPPGWHEVADPISGRFYYWHVETDQVCWLSPRHPRARVTLAEIKLKQIGIEQSNERKSPPSKSANEHGRVRSSSSEERSPSSGSDSDRGKNDDVRRRRHRHDDSSKLSKEHRSRSNVRRRNQEEMDPMDPAAYSDTPRGTWSTGLDTRGKPRSGVDSTASGPLFQQRPYPSPGEILRANAHLKKDSDRKN